MESGFVIRSRFFHIHRTTFKSYFTFKYVNGVNGVIINYKVLFP